LTRLKEFAAPYQAEAKPRRIEIALTQNFSAARGIVEFAGQLTAPLVIMGTHGRSGLAQTLVGTTTERVLHQCPGSALLVRTQPAVIRA
jgi:nucleotide-binding universal stress UspA family protein